MINPRRFFLKDDGIFPNSPFPVLLYKRAIVSPAVLPALAMIRLFRKNGWANNWRDGIFTYHHYHSITHEVVGVVKGKTMVQLGGDQGVQVEIEKGDILVIPAGVAHKNLGAEKDVICVGGYPGGHNFDIKYGKPEERPAADHHIEALPIPETDPVTGNHQGLPEIWALQLVDVV
jgi:uncharacterized protein YjlB